MKGKGRMTTNFVEPPNPTEELNESSENIAQTSTQIKKKKSCLDQIYGKISNQETYSPMARTSDYSSGGSSLFDDLPREKPNLLSLKAALDKKKFSLHSIDERRTSERRLDVVLDNYKRHSVPKDS